MDPEIIVNEEQRVPGNIRMHGHCGRKLQMRLEDVSVDSLSPPTHRHYTPKQSRHDVHCNSMSVDLELYIN
jgi:hypothetical protein